MLMHKSVLLKEAIDGLNIKPSGKYVDATIGYAGHSSVILEKLNKEGFLFAFDQDEKAVEYSFDRLNQISTNFKIFKDNFKNLINYLDCNIDGFLFDLGVSSPQLDEVQRGFSYHSDALLDMRMDTNQKLDAAYVVNNYTLEKLTDIFYKYGEEKYSKSIAKNIIKSRPITTTLELSEIIKGSVPLSYRNQKHPARKVFQALRIEVNNELDILDNTIRDAFDLLNPGGRIVVITFHSLEDKIIKDVFKSLSSNIELKGVPYNNGASKAIIITKKPIIPTNEEIEINNRSRSAKLRIIQKI
ncbi:MAG: 16S rRNA (cytosine(1402)-N(4))-methyltransferase RsmH [Bacilli bacterium]